MRGGELVATDESTIVAKPFLDAVVMENSQSDGCFSDSPWSDECKWTEVFGEANDLLNQLIASKTGPWWWGRQFSRRDTE